MKMSLKSEPHFAGFLLRLNEPKFQGKDAVVRVSYVEVDNDDVHDLLSDVDGPTSVEKRRVQDVNGARLVLDGVAEIECASVSDAWCVILFEFPVFINHFRDVEDPVL